MLENMVTEDWYCYASLIAESSMAGRCELLIVFKLSGLDHTNYSNKEKRDSQSGTGY